MKTALISLIVLVVAVAIFAAIHFARFVKSNSMSLACHQAAGTRAMIAQYRDEGASREDLQLRLADSFKDRYSAEQIEAMFDAVYVHGVGKSWEEIKAVAVAECAKYDNYNGR